MADTVTVKNKKQGFFAKMGNSFASIPLGIVIVIFGCMMLWNNEKKNVINIKDVKELRGQVVDVTSSEVNNDNEGKLIATSGKLDFNNAIISDTEFNISFTTPVFDRNVEIYQWVETSTTTDDETKYTYKKEWKSELVDSDDFNTTNGHVNPTETEIKYFGERFSTDEDLKVGAFTLDEGFKTILSSDKSVNIPEEAVIPEGYTIYNSRYITNAADMNNPEVGNIRISYKINDYKTVSVLGKQVGSTITSYASKNNKTYRELYEGSKTSTEMINSIEAGNKMSKWIFRILGTILVCLGMSMILSPLTTLIGYIPFLGKIVNGAIGVVSSTVGLAVSLLTIAVAWLVYRPIIGIALIVVSVGLVILAKKYISKKDDGKKPESKEEVKEEENKEEN